MPVYSVFMILYLLLFGLFLFTMSSFGIDYPPSVSAIDFLLLCLATFRITELITYDRITKVLRDPFLKREEVQEPDGTVDVKVKPAGSGIQKAIGELIICPWCIGIWIGTLLTYMYLLVPGPARVLLLAISAAAGGILFQLFAKLLDQATDKS